MGGSIDGQPARRYVVEILAGEPRRPEGTVWREGHVDPSPFSGWMDLLRLLEPAGWDGAPATTIAGLGASDGGG